MALSLKLIKDSVNKVAVSRYLLVIIMANFIIESRSLPITSEKESSRPWWCEPCQNHHKTRHSRAIGELLKDQLKIIISHFNNNVRPYQSHIHRKIENVPNKQLNKLQWLRYRKFYKLLNNGSKKILPELLYQTQVFAATIEALLKMEILVQDDSFDKQKRTEALELLKFDINSLRCTIEFEIAEKQVVVTKQVSHNFAKGKIPLKEEDTKELLIMDFRILKNYEKFINACKKKLFKKAKKKQGASGQKPKQNKRIAKKKTPTS